MTTTTTVAALRADMITAAASNSGDAILEEFLQRLCKSLSTEDAATVMTVRNILEPLLDAMAVEYGVSI